MPEIQTLDFCAKSINPPPPHRFTVVSLFSGCGGSSLGYKWAGGKVLVALDNDAHAIETYRLNHQGTPILQRDIITLSVADLETAAGISLTDLDILDGSPPCQGFSSSGRRQMADPRNALYQEYVRLLRALRPKVFVMENVSGLVEGRMKHIFADIMRSLKASGYAVRCQLFNTAYYGVPQSRERLIFLGVRSDLGIPPSFPLPFTQPITPRQSFAGMSSQDAPPLPEWLLRAAQEMDAGNYSGESYLRAFRKYSPHGTYGALNTKLLAWDRCACTLVKTEILWKSMVIHPDRQRLLSLDEMKRLASFPDAFVFPGIRQKAVARIGNSVPPRFMQAIADHIVQQILHC